MGLMLSILIVCVGVIEALSCYHHFQYGVLNCATTAYKNARRRSSALLLYGSRRLGFLSEDPLIETDEQSDKQPPKSHPTNGFEAYKSRFHPSDSHRLSTSGDPANPDAKEKKLAKEDKVQIVRRLLDGSTRPKPLRSISSPGLICTARDLELTNIINDLASEPIDEAGTEASDAEALTKEFEKLFDEYEESAQHVLMENTIPLSDIFGENDSKLEIDFGHFGDAEDDKMDAILDKKELLDKEIINSEEGPNPVATTLSQKTQGVIYETASVDSDKLISREIDKSTSVDVDSADLSKICTHPPTYDSFPMKSSVTRESTSQNELADRLFESERDVDFTADNTRREIHNVDLIEKKIAREEGGGSEEENAKSGGESKACDPRQVPGSGKGTDEERFLRAVDQLADLILAKCLNVKEMRTAISSAFAASVRDDSKAPEPEKEKVSSDAFDLPLENQKYDCADPAGYVDDREETAVASCMEKIDQVDSTPRRNPCDEADDSNFGDSSVTRIESERPAPVPVPLISERKAPSENSEKMGKTAENFDSSDGESVGVAAFRAGTLEQDRSETTPSSEAESSKIQTQMSELSESDVSKSSNEKVNTKWNYELPDGMEEPDLSLTTYGVIDLGTSPEETDQETLFDLRPEPERTSVDGAHDATPHAEVILALEYRGKAGMSHPRPSPEEAVPVDQQKEVQVSGCPNDSDNGKPKEVNVVSREDFLASEEANVFVRNLADSDVSGLSTGKVSDGNLGEMRSPESNSVEDRGHDSDRRRESLSRDLSAPDGGSKAASSSGCEAFWLIFSGEYTKAMSKDWHSGHFSCWQCDEALTGQRYVLRDDHPYCIKCYESVFANVCEECNKIIGIDSKDLSYKDKHWHEACFLCNKCRVSLVDKQFGSKAEKIYCGNCYDAQFASRCDGCGEIFRAGTKKMEYKTRQWHEKCFCCCVCKTPIGTKSFIPREQEIYCATCYEEKFATRCVKCNKIITSGGVTYKNEPWHRECFTCTSCNTSLAGQRFTSRDEKPYCADCFGELFAKRCTACSRPITGIGGTRFISFENRHWHNDCFICASCKTSLVGRGFITDGDDIICPECAKQKLM